jgi:hypothetical protein
VTASLTPLPKARPIERKSEGAAGSGSLSGGFAVAAGSCPKLPASGSLSAVGSGSPTGANSSRETAAAGCGTLAVVVGVLGALVLLPEHAETASAAKATVAAKLNRDAIMGFPPWTDRRVFMNPLAEPQSVEITV